MRIWQLLFLLLIVVCIVSCKKKNTVQPTSTDFRTTQISKKWRMTEYYINSVSVKLATDDYLQLNTDKTYSERKYKVIVSGNWDWQENQTQISMNSGIWKVLTLSNDHLELEKTNAQPSEKLVLHQF
jgi:hypothetical protein